MTADYGVAVRDHMVDLLHLDGELAALIEMRPEVDHLLIVNVAVSPAHQGQGYGRALLVHAEELTRSLGLEEVRLYTNGSFTNNVKLYKSVGYRIDRKEVHPQLGAAVYMSKRLLPVSPPPLTEAIRAGLRRATPADAAAVRDLTRAAYAQWVPVLGREAKPMTADYDVAVHDHIVDMLYVDGELAALIEMYPETDHLLIVNVAVSPACQGHGYGRALLAHAEEFTRSLGLGEMRLYTSNQLTGNVKLYERVGYKVDREEEAAPHLGVFVYMSKRLV
ncbi:GNAT family N-acetyltransferase [Acidisphaera sp. S103]|uniref:GNAT family N-acetyltransferase n=1 Tax=Acidisphaera sp. S103 TaxID=1747223 RepID=UPI0020B116E9|nr:GNAT family N-acetyltransferase [Acidisphaera sp. S103]